MKIRKALARLARACLGSRAVAWFDHAEPPAEPDPHEEFFHKARALSDLGRNDEALEILKEGLSATEGHLKLLSLARTIASKQRRIDETIDFGSQIAAKAPDDHKNRLALAQAYFDRGDFQLAIDQADFLIAACPENVRGFILKARALSALDRNKEALEILKEGLAAHEGHSTLLSLARTVSFQEGRLDETIDFGTQLAAQAPNDQKNRLALAKAYFARGDLQLTIDQADVLIAASPPELWGFLFKIQALVAQHRMEDALQVSKEGLSAHNEDMKLLDWARYISSLHGEFEECEGYSRSMVAKEPDNDLNHTRFVETLMALGKTDEVKDYLAKIDNIESFPVLKQMNYNLSEYSKLNDKAPAIVSAWRTALENKQSDPSIASAPEDLPLTMIQYWSQGHLPEDLNIVYSAWKDLFKRCKLGEIRLFDRVTAGSWIEKNAPEYTSAFANAFHYALESDVFRIAYASKLPCIYMDVDSWPLPGTADVIRSAATHNRSMLYFRSYRPWIVNGSFVSFPHCPFFQELAAQCRTVDLSVLPKNHRTIEHSFGPSRYNKVLLDILAGEENMEVSPGSARGTSNLALESGEIGFAHEGVFAGVRPPFALGYKKTEANWRRVSLED